MSYSSLARKHGSFNRGGSGSAAASDRFNLLLLEDGEYFFKGHTAYWWTEAGTRVVGSLQVCSHSLFFVPRDLQQPIFRIPFKSTTAIEPLDEPSPHGEDQLAVCASQRVDMTAGPRATPYQQHAGSFRFRFSLVYACLEDVLPVVEELCLLAHAAGAAHSKEERVAAAQKLQDIIKAHEERELFNPGWLDDEESVVVEAVASAVSPLAAQPGRAVLTQQRIYFQPFNLQSAAPIQAYSLARVVAVARRVYQLEDLGLEVFFSSRHSIYLAFRATADRNAFQRALAAQPSVQLERMRSREQWTRDWVHGRISNFDYLMHLNREAGRSFKDLSQYPVMPWVVADYSSPTLDLSDPGTYRDLSKPIGALSPRRLAEFQQRFAELKQMAAVGGRQTPGAPPPLDMPPFLYGCHYSSPGYVVFYLMRSDPQLMLRLQNGRFDAADRLFWSIGDTWKSVLSLPSDVKELVPEFYSNDPSFLVNKQGVDFGCRSGGQPVGDVALPPWASDASDFLYKLQEALESPHVSARLHKWIDLVFGRKARGTLAEKADNVFHYLTYDEVALRFLHQEGDPLMREALRLQMMEFGRTPRQLFTRKHPKRRVLGRGGSALACFGCFAPLAQQQLPRVSTNLLHGKPFDARSIPPVSRAVFKLSCSPKLDKRQALLQFLEHTAAHGEPDALALRQTRGAELFMLVKAARDARDGRPGAVAPAAEMHSNLVRAVAALATCLQNRRYILDAGCLDPVVEALAAPQPELAAAAVQALALLAREDSPRLQALDARTLGLLVDVVRQPPAADSLLAALEAVTLLAEAYPAHRAFFARQDLLSLLQAQLHTRRAAAAAEESELGEPSPVTGPGSKPGLSPTHRGQTRALRRRTTIAGQAGERGPAVVHPALLQRQQLLAMAAMLQDDAQKELLLAADGALPELLADCCSSRAEVRGGAFECLASLTSHDALRGQVGDLGLLPLVLGGAADGSSQVQQPAAACVANLCTDPALVLEQLGSEPGLGPVVALALAADGEVQRHAAAALWHLAQLPEARTAAVDAGALTALLSLARLQRNVTARDLARQALLRCSDDEAVRPQLEEAAAAVGVDQVQLAAMLSPSSARSHHSSFQRKARHRKMYSEVPSSLSGAVSRTSSFRSGLDHGSPAYAMGGAPAAELWPGEVAEPASPQAASSPAAGGSPLLASPAGSGWEAAPATNGSAQQLPPRLTVPEASPLPLPIITPVGGSDSPPGAKRQPAAEPTATNQTPNGVQASKVPQLNLMSSHPLPSTPE
ncbi:hypothetical protein D9Q98_000485 [Chlorella vulgaris]|uniref:Uncharacterized protein n=1 Tax=Chlorella vulgaris TaxID=3077 RepID=A0A9D4TYF0_CHLVU|nr:hypothetical protein D9Q98_000485 [Chlorella vulgaris]